MTSRSARPELFGLLNINKPPGMTSRDVVNHVQRLIRPTKVGHAGTLDPLATGVLILGIGKATRLVQYIQRMPKEYRATFLLGKASDTDDIEGEVVDVASAPIPTEPEVRAKLANFTGEIEQRPPAYSAVKVAGKRAYKRARQGEEVKIDSRRVVVHAIDIVSYEYPELIVDVKCGSGTYIRSIGRDLGTSLGSSAIMSALERTAIGGFSAHEATSLDEVTGERLAHLLIPAVQAVGSLPCVELSEVDIERAVHGLAIDASRATPPPGLLDGQCDEIAAVNSHGELVAILKLDNDKLRPVHTFVPQPQG